MRKVIFGNKYWVEKTRTVKAKSAKGVNALSLTSRINLIDERWTLHDLKDGVIDGKGRPYVAPEWKEQDNRDIDATEGLERNQKEEAEDLAQEILDKRDDPNDPVWEQGQTSGEGAEKKAEEKRKLDEDQKRANEEKMNRKKKAKEAEQRQKARKVVSDKKKDDAKDENKFEVKKHVDKSGRYHQKEDKEEKQKKKQNKDEEVRERKFILVNGKLVEFFEGALIWERMSMTARRLHGVGLFHCQMPLNGSFRMISWMCISNDCTDNTCATLRKRGARRFKETCWPHVQEACESLRRLNPMLEDGFAWVSIDGLRPLAWIETIWSKRAKLSFLRARDRLARSRWQNCCRKV